MDDSPAAPPAPRRPNLLVLFPDQFRRQAQGFRGEDPTLTPHIDRLAAEGLECARAYANAPLCSPARAMWHTGRYPFSNGVVSNCHSGHVDYGVYLKATERCLSDVLADSGYEVGYIGKWHLDGPVAPFAGPPAAWDGNVWDAYTPPGPLRHGHSFWHSYGCYDDHLRPHYWLTEPDTRIDVEDWSPFHETDVALEYLRNRGGLQRDADRPFALTVSWNPPHPPHDQVPAIYGARYRGRSPQDLLINPNVDHGSSSRETAQARHDVAAYFAAVSGIDDQVGRILECLREEGLEGDTLVVFASDHGEMMGSHDRMQKVVWYEESMAIPFLLRWPGHIPAGGRSDVLLGMPDVMPSLLGLLGLGDQIPATVEGTDFSRAMRGEPQTGPEALLYLDAIPGLTSVIAWVDEGAQATTEYDPATLAALRADPERTEHLVSLMAGNGLGSRGVRTQRYTYVITREPGIAEERLLFDDERDPSQLENRAAAEPQVVRHMHALLRDLLAKTGDPWALRLDML